MAVIGGRLMRGLIAALLGLGVGTAPVRLAARQQVDSNATIEKRLARVSADIFSRTDHVDANITELKAILGADPRSAQAHMLLGIAYRTKGSPDLIGEAAGEFRQAIELDPSLIPARLYLAHLYLDLGRPERAREELQAALARAPAQPQCIALLGETERQLGNPEKALELTGQVLAADAGFAEAQFYRGLALYDLKRRDEAIQEFEQVVQAGGRRPEVYSSLGIAYLDAGRVDQAIASFTDGVALDPSRADLWIRLARAYRLKGQLNKAESQLTRARAFIVATAVSASDQELQRDFYVEDGVIRLGLGQLEAAARSLRKAVDLDSNSGTGRRYLAEVYIRQGLYARANDQAVRAGKLGSPLPPNLQKTLEEKLRASHPKGHE
jgi:tetratricopeptide (TPR) repeat protein